MNLLTIFTPSYNRAYILPQLYNSLVRQSDKRFEWVIVDDGSKDNTKELVESWIKEEKIKIVYKQQPNQGKHIAINTGVQLSTGELFFIVDSDDFLTDNAVEKIFAFWNKQNISNEAISGIVSYRQFFDGKLVGTYIPDGISRCKLRDLGKKYGSKGDKVVVFKTDIMRMYPYPKFDEERFLGESYVFNQIDDKYDMIVLNDKLYYFAYQPDGLSQDFRKLYRNNPKGFLASYEQERKYAESFSEKIKITAHIVCLCIKLRKYGKLFRGRMVIERLLAAPLGIALYIKIFVIKANDVKPYVESEDNEM